LLIHAPSGHRVYSNYEIHLQLHRSSLTNLNNVIGSSYGADILILSFYKHDAPMGCTLRQNKHVMSSDIMAILKLKADMDSSILPHF
jgi:hypothetical protein